MAAPSSICADTLPKFVHNKSLRAAQREMMVLGSLCTEISMAVLGIRHVGDTLVGDDQLRAGPSAATPVGFAPPPPFCRQWSGGPAPLRHQRRAEEAADDGRDNGDGHAGADGGRDLHRAGQRHHL